MAEPLAEWEREYLESPRYRAMREAANLRDAATILTERTTCMTFGMRVVILVLERTASKLDHPSS